MTGRSIDFTRRKSYNSRRVSELLSVLLVLAALLLLYSRSGRGDAVSASAPAVPLPVLVIDPGHGGIDGGAVGIDGTKESDLNLRIALKMQAIAQLYGAATQMTRVDDSRRTDILAYSEHEDLVYRTNLINQVDNGVLFSVHMNFFPTSQPSGAQILYAAGEGSAELGELTQHNIVSYLQPENRRLAEPAPSRLYITSHVSCPAILAECGFLSNLSELEKLCDNRYQSSMALLLTGSYLQFINPTIST